METIILKDGLEYKMDNYIDGYIFDVRAHYRNLCEKLDQLGRFYVKAHEIKHYIQALDLKLNMLENYRKELMKISIDNAEGIRNSHG